MTTEIRISLNGDAVVAQEFHRDRHRHLHGVQVFGEGGHHFGLEELLLVPVWTLFWQSKCVEKCGPARACKVTSPIQ